MRVMRYNRGEKRAQKEYTCDTCGQPIIKGEKYVSHALSVQPDFVPQALKSHRKCYYMQFFTSNTQGDDRPGKDGVR